MPRVFLHIGPPKTGSTSIQRMMDRLPTNDAPILYPRNGRPRPGQSYWVERSGGRFVESGPAESHQFLAWSIENKIEGLSPAECWDPLIEELRQSSVPTAVLSAEGFFHLHDTHVSKIAELLAEFDTKIIYYFRNAFRRAISLYGQGVKVGKFDQSFSQFLADYYGEQSRDQSHAIMRWGRSFGSDNLIVKPFEALQHQSNLCNDFLQTINAPPSIGDPLLNSNQRLPAETIRSIRRLNQLESRWGRSARLRPWFQRVRAFLRGRWGQRIVTGIALPSLRCPIYSSQDESCFLEAIADWYPPLVRKYIPQEFHDYYLNCIDGTTLDW